MKSSENGKTDIQTKLRYLFLPEKDKSKKQLNTYAKKMFFHNFLCVFVLCLLCETTILLVSHSECSFIFLFLMVSLTSIASFCIGLYIFEPIFTIIFELMNNPLNDQEISTDVIKGYIKKVNSYQQDISSAIKNISSDVQLGLFLDLIKQKPITEEYIHNTLKSISCRFTEEGLFFVYAFQCISAEMQMELKQRLLFEADFFDVVSIVLLPDEIHLALVLEFKDKSLTEADVLKKTENIEKTILQGLLKEFSGMTFSKGYLCHSVNDIGFSYEQALSSLENDSEKTEFNLIERQIILMIRWYMEGAYIEGDELKSKINDSITDCSQASNVIEFIIDAIKQYNFFEWKFESQDLINSYSLSVSDEENIKQNLYNAMTAILDEIRTQVDKHNNPLILKAKRIITEHYYDSSLTQANMAERLGVTVEYFSRLFASSMGVTYLKYLNNHRVGLSMNLLRNTDMTLEEISDKCGFFSTRSYIAAFKNRYGITPTTWRKNRFIC